jgi:surfeit locus 1 family protein
MISISQTGFDLNSLLSGNSSDRPSSDGLVGRINLVQIEKQVGIPLLPIYIQETPDPAFTGLPERIMPQIDLSEGPHLSYAIQWFSFTVILLVVFILFIHKKLRVQSDKEIALSISEDHQKVNG